MRQSELLSRIVLAHEITPRDPLLRDEYFVPCKDEWGFLKDYFEQFGSLPNKATFLTQFPDFPFEDTENTAQWLADEVAQDHINSKVAQKLDELAVINEIDPRTAAKTFGDIAREFATYTSTIKQPVGLLDPALRVDETERRRRIEGLSGVTLGFDLLDNVTQGTQSGEVEIYFARPGQTKSYTLLYGAIMAARDGHKVSFMSPEMDAYEMGVRADSYTMHVSSQAMLGGKQDEDDWHDYLMKVARTSEELENYAPLNFYEPTAVGRAFNTADVATIIKRDEPDLVCIDGVMLIEPMAKDKDIRKTLINTMKELKEIAVQTGVPIRLAHQANRQSEGGGRRRGNLTLDELIPHLSHMAESDSVAQYANRAIAIARIRDRTYFAVRKNRGGPSGRIVSIEHDIDSGRYHEALIVSGDTAYDELEVQVVQVEPSRYRF